MRPEGFGFHVIIYLNYGKSIKTDYLFPEKG